MLAEIEAKGEKVASKLPAVTVRKRGKSSL